MKKKAVLRKLLFVLFSLTLCFGLLLVAEVSVRLLGDIRFLGNSKHLFVANAYGDSNGNSKNTEAVSFGAHVRTDAYGFRIPESAEPQDESRQRAVLILGDSVAFGPGVLEEKTFAGLLRAKHSSTTVHNASVIGYRTADYKNFIHYFHPERKNVEQVYLLLCLNDVSRQSATEIERSLRASQAREQSTPMEKSVEMFRGSGVIRAMNGYLRSSSKLYLLMKGLLTDPQARHWHADYRLYLDDNSEALRTAMRDIADVNAMLHDHNIGFTVIISPYEYQLRDHNDDNFLPQRQLREHFSRLGIPYIDAAPIFADQGRASKEFFLPYDPMHFSEKGHQIIYNIIADDFDSRSARQI